MIGCTKLLCGRTTVSQVIKKQRQGNIPPHLLQFSAPYRPVVVWNITNRCNLNCRHCYTDANPDKFCDELTTGEAKKLIEDLGKMRVPVLLFSGGEPLLRKDIFELALYAKKFGIRCVLSTNGTLINGDVAENIKKAGFGYVGVSIDGVEETHARLRQNKKAFNLAFKGLEVAKKSRLQTGVRFTITGENYKELNWVLNLVEKKNIPRFCMYHLVYSGRGKNMLSVDTNLRQKRATIHSIITRIQNNTANSDNVKNGTSPEILTVDNPADGIYIYHLVKKCQKGKEHEILELLKRAGGCSAGEKVASIDSHGNVHPCQFWEHLCLGNVRRQKFSQIWLNSNNEILLNLREKENHLKGKCGGCEFANLCGGCRIRAEAVYDDIWEEDPACYLTKEEIKR